MGDHDIQATCLSAEPHEGVRKGPNPAKPAIRDYVLHFLGCVEFERRRKFFDEENPIWEAEKEHIVGSSTDPRVREKAELDVREKRRRCFSACIDELRRIDVVRQKLENDEAEEKAKSEARRKEHKEKKRNAKCGRIVKKVLKTEVDKTEDDEDEWKGLVENLKDSLGEWKKAEGRDKVEGHQKAESEFQIGKQAICKWKQSSMYLHSQAKFNTWGLSSSRDKPSVEQLEADWERLFGSGASEDGIGHGSGVTTTRPQTSATPQRSRHDTAQRQGTENSDPSGTDTGTGPSARPEEMQESGSGKGYDPEKDINAYIIQYEQDDKHDYSKVEEPSSHDISSLKGHHPDQRVSIEALLGKAKRIQESARWTVDYVDPKTNLLYRDRAIESKNGKSGRAGTSRLRWFHLPANNMSWVERAVALYFGQDVPEYDGMYRELQGAEQTHAYMILRSQYWRGQQHGGRSDVVHARHMRPMCELLSSDPEKSEKDAASPRNNVVLYMPYLHWDTDRKRDQFSIFMDNATQEHRVFKKEHEAKQREDRVRLRKGIEVALTELLEKLPEDKPKPCSELLHTFQGLFRLGQSKGSNQSSEKGSEQNDKSQHPNRSQTFGSLVGSLGFPKDRLKVKDGRVIAKRALGQYFIDAARLYEAMANYRDKKLLEKYLHVDPPLHPRRTLDQAYYWSLNTTRSRDRDQVVFRGTRAPVHQLHQYDHKKQCWPKHEEQEIKGPCPECRQSIRRVSRVVMVDQLWMWILDEKTILTCFPKRYGSNKNDGSGVHRGIRARLKTTPESQIKSVFDLALIIIDECSNTFFDRTKTPDRQPQVLDIFSEAIGNVTNKQTAAFERLWLWTDRARGIYRSKTPSVYTSSLDDALLDINPEGKLQREIKDIIEELDIMIYINRTQKHVLMNFIAQVETLLDPEGQFRRRADIWRIGPDHSFRETSSPTGTQDQDRSNPPRTPLKDKEAKGRTRSEYDRFKQEATDLLNNMTRRCEELEHLRETAKSTSESIKDLLGLKQQQAGVVQAWQSVKEAEESLNQGRAIMVFTIVTIVFAPLSFMSSIFGMNAQEFSPSQNTYPLNTQLKWLGVVSAAVIPLTLTIAFGTWIRAIIWSAYRISSTAAVVYLPIPWLSLYRIWMRMDIGASTLGDIASKLVKRMTDQAKKEEYKRRARKKKDEERRKDTTTPFPPWLHFWKQDESKNVSIINGEGSMGSSSNGKAMPLGALFANGRPTDIESGQALPTRRAQRSREAAQRNQS